MQPVAAPHVVMTVEFLDVFLVVQFEGRVPAEGIAFGVEQDRVVNRAPSLRVVAAGRSLPDDFRSENSGVRKSRP